MLSMADMPRSPLGKRSLHDHPDNRHDASTTSATPPRAARASSIESDTVSTPLSSAPSHSALDAVALPMQPNFTSKMSSQEPAPPPAKRRKITVEEKEQIRLEKIAKDKARDEAKAQREEERRAKDEEKKQKKEKAEEERRTKEEAARAKREQREEMKRVKELEQSKKEEEKLKKERSQLRLNSFFTKPSASGSNGSPLKPTPFNDVSEQQQRRKSLSVEPPLSLRGSAPPSPFPKKDTCDYLKCFLPFELPTHAVLAQHSRAILNDDQIQNVYNKLDKIDATLPVPLHRKSMIQDLKDNTRMHGIQYRPPTAVRTLMAQVYGSSDDPIDLTEGTSKQEELHPLQALGTVTMKFLHFHEDVRPPYHGTFTKVIIPEHARRLGRNPFKRELPEANYDYDSEAEWEEPEEGEDLDSELEDDNESVDDEEDMDGFLDDEEDTLKRQQITSDLDPCNSGIWWEDGNGVSRRAGHESETSRDFNELKIGFLLEPRPTSINPFSTSYWITDISKAHSTMPTTNGQVTISGLLGAGSMNPPRAPLSVRPNNNINSTIKSSNDPTKTSKNLVTPGITSKPPDSGKRMVPPEIIDDFRKEVEGSDMTQIAMVEALKKKFPKVPKDAIQNTLKATAHRVGKGHAKTWALL